MRAYKLAQLLCL